jgi:predicted S18 family serine protease
MKKIFTLIMVILITLSAFAQSPQKMSYQCVVRNASGVLVTNQSIGIRISILQGTPTGSVVYQETYNPNPQTNVNGLISIEIGGGLAITGTFSTINWEAGPYFF